MSRSRALRSHLRAERQTRAAHLPMLWVALVVLAAIGCEGEQGPAGPPGQNGSGVCCAGLEFIGEYSALRADGSSTEELRVRATTYVGNAVEGLTVRFAIDDGEGQLSTNSGVTDASGEVTTTYTSGSRPGYTVIIASIGIGTVTTRDTTEVWIDPLIVSAPLLTSGYDKPLVASWSQDGSWITYCQMGDYDYQDFSLYKVSAKGGTSERLGYFRGGAWNFDGSNRIAAWDVQSNIYILASDGNILNGPFNPDGFGRWYDEEVRAVGWCYGGDSLLVAANINHTVYICDTTGSGRRGEIIFADTFSPVPNSPNGVMEGTREFNRGVYTVNLTTYAFTTLAEHYNYFIYAGADVKQDGSIVVFSESEYSRGPGTLFTIPFTGGSETTLFDCPMDEKYPVWSPDGTKVLFTSNRSAAGYNLYILDVAP